ncbi:MAG: phosphoenolpyruvate carboxykinase (GTP) [Candidatus Omnitrophica bacterium]|nr:phosphoenolpyruvate carboxykinase (GTP) [Candidatus Omnitrophota bacterium]
MGQASSGIGARKTGETQMTQHKGLLKWVEEMTQLCQPDRVVWCDGSEEEKKRLEKQALSSGELIELNPKKLPGCFLHRTAQNDVARTENLTFICTLRKEDAGPNNNWMSPNEAYAKASTIFRGAMKARTMYVIPFSMGQVSSPFSKIGVELTDSIYVVLNMRIMTRMGTPVLNVLGANGEFTKGLHSKADLDINRRLILHFPEDNTIWSVGSGYGGNVLLGKKCLALRIASWLGKKEGWMAEHMLVLGIEKPNGEIKFITAAFPSACGKTNLAMIVPPEGLKHKGYKIWTVGDDIAWLRIGRDGQLRAVNPEAGFFGVLPGTNSKTNAVAMATIKRNTIYTNVVLAPDKTVWWEGGDGEPPQEGMDWKGNPWKPGMKDKHGKPIPGAQPNSRFTAPIGQCPTYHPKLDDPEGVPISAVVFGGRRAHVTPLVYESFNWQHGVYVASQMASERTAAQYGKQGEVRRDPMAMFPFCGYNMADYFAHWLAMGKRMKNPPKIFHVNWFRTGQDGKFLWPGFGDNLRVLEWILKRVEGHGEARETAIGYIPTSKAIDLTGLHLKPNVMDELLSIDRQTWLEDLKLQEAFYAQFGERLPKEIRTELEGLKKRLEA